MLKIWLLYVRNWKFEIRNDHLASNKKGEVNLRSNETRFIKLMNNSGTYSLLKPRMLLEWLLDYQLSMFRSPNLEAPSDARHAFIRS